MSEEPRGLVPSAGWAVLHLFFRIDRGRWRSLTGAERTTAVDEFAGWLDACSAEEGLQLVPFAGVTKSDFGLVAVHPELWRVQQLTQDIAHELEAAGLLTDVVGALQVKESLPLTVWHRGLEAIGSK